LIGHPNLWDNLRILSKNPQFQPIRMLFVSWLIFSVTVGSTGIYALINSPKAKASSDFSIKTGYYFGNGTTLSVTGIGFTPQIVIVKSETAAGQLVWKSSVMPSNVSTYLGVADGDNTETEITLDADGFTVSPALEVNTIHLRYIYIAFAGSDCTSGGVMCVGLYTGDTNATQAITTGFQPDLVWVKRSTSLAGNFRTSAMGANEAALFSATANNNTGVYFQTLDANGFTVGSTNNTNGGVYYYVAFKNVAGKLTVGQFNGNGVDNRNITSLGFEPDFVLVKQNSAVAPAFNTTETWGDYSAVPTAAASAVNRIQELQADGFQVGTATNVNALGILSNYFAFGGAPDPTPSDSFFMQRGSYTGTGVAKSIETSFAPDLVIIKANYTEQAVWSTSLFKDLTQYFAVTTVGFSGGITSMGTTSFSIGTHSTVNTNGINYEYVVYGNATSPLKGVKAADFAIGAHTGNAITSRAIDHLGFDPDLVVIKRVDSAGAAVWSSSAMAANTNAYFSATIDTTDGSIFQTFNATGFTLGSGGANTANVEFAWFAFKEGSFFDVGSYAGDSVDDRSVTGLGFTPDYVWTKRTAATGGVHKSSSGTIGANESQHFLALANSLNHIKTLIADGFTLGTSTEANATGSTYNYASWKSSTSSYPPDMPTNSSPPNASTTVNLNPALIASAYSDTEANPHINTEWRIDDDSNFSSPVWTRTAGGAEITTTVTLGNGTFANELSGKTELDHDSTYYWQVRYSDGVWSDWSSATNFVSNIFSTPVNSSPANGGTVTSLTPTLSASAFSDEQVGHTASSSQWQISNSSSFSSPLYDSEEVSYSVSHAVPGATLADRATYYWHVRYKDSLGQWSSYSTITSFAVSESIVSVVPVFGNTVVDQGDAVNIDVQVKLTNGTVINNATTTISIYNPSGTKIVDGVVMTSVASSSGIYRYGYTIPAVSGSYLYEVTSISDNRTGYGAANFEVRTIASDVSSVKSTVEAEEAAQTAERTAQAVERAAEAAERLLEANNRLQVNEIHASTTDIQEKVTDIQSRVTNIQSNLDILIGAMVVTQSSVNDLSASTTSFLTLLTNPTDNFYKNAVLTFTSGALDGQSRRVSAYDSVTSRITLDPALTSAPTNGSGFTIVAQNVRVEEQVATNEAVQALFRASTTLSLANIESKIDTLTTTLNNVDSDLGTVQTSVDAIRASQQKSYKVTLSDVSEVQASSTYRTKLTILDYESNPVDASSTPTLLIYDATRTLAQATTVMTKISDGVYEYTSNVLASSTTGLWETIVNVDVGGVSDIVVNDYWQVTGAPAQVIINSMSDLSVPSISANVTITNEGNASFEYQYEWCVVGDQSDQCGGGDDIYYASAAKLIDRGEDFDTTLSATVPTVGTYYFKVVVYYGTEASGASRLFTATLEGEGEESAGGSYSSTGSVNIYYEIAKIREELQLNSQKLLQALAVLNIVNPNIQQLLRINNLNTESLIDIQNKTADLRAVSASTRRMIEQQTVEPVVETYMKFSSTKTDYVENNFLITNPDLAKQTVKFKAFLPEEVKPESITNLDGLKIDYDTNAHTYFVYGDIVLGPKETVTRQVEIRDVWAITSEEIQSIKNQVASLVPVLSKTQYEAQVAILKSDIESTLNIITLNQQGSYSSPQDHIVAYRENKERFARVESSLAKIKDLITQSGVSRGVVGQIGGIQTFATWGIILALFFGFGLLGAVVFAMWRHQTMLAALAMGMNKDEVLAQFGKTNKRGRKSEDEEAPSISDSENEPRPPKTTWFRGLKELIISVIILGAVIAAVKYLPPIFEARVIVFENKNTPVSISIPAAVSVQLPENNIGSVLTPSSITTSTKQEVNEEEVTRVEKKIQKLQITKTPTGWLNVRATASSEGKILAKVYSNEKFEYTDYQNGWYKIILNDKSVGWISGVYIKTI